MRLRLMWLVLIVLTPAARAEPLRILHVASYHMSWDWNREQFQAFREELNDLAIDYRIVELDAKRSSPDITRARAEQAIRLIQDWKPHLVYVNDDVAQEAVTIKFLNHAIPFVYSGVNRAPKDYGFDKAGNIAGVLEREHFLPSLRLLTSLKPGVRKLAVITDTDPAWQSLVVRMRAELAGNSDIQVIEWARPRSYDEYKRKVLGYQKTADALVLLGVFNFVVQNGAYADYEEVQRWTVHNSRLPDMSFWETRVERGTLSAVTISGLEQGRQAGRIARKILVDHVPPSEIGAVVDNKGLPSLSLARARDLGLAVPSSLLLSSKVFTFYMWSR